MRTYSGSEEGDDRVDSQSQVIVALPLTLESIPIEEAQYFYAFLPVQRTNFKVGRAILPQAMRAY